MQLASDMLAAAGIAAPDAASRSARATGSRSPRRSAAATRTAVADAVRAELEVLGEGRLAVVTVLGAEDALRAALVAALPDGHGR